jgi:hypothetical protein
MKNCLITGGGSKFGSKITEQLVQAGYHVYLLTGSQQVTDPNITVISVDWYKLNLEDIRRIISNLPNLDLIFFNHNASALSQTKFNQNQIQSLKDWQQSYFVSCQFPFYLIHSLKNKISNTTKIGWMLSELISNPNSTQIGFADYIGNKFTNGCIMKSFAQSFPSIFFGINPGSVGNSNDVSKAIKIVELIKHTADLNGKIYYSNGTIFNFG